MNKRKLRYAILKSMELKSNTITADSLGISEEVFFENIVFLYREGYITKPIFASDVVYTMRLSKLTEKGESYIEDNSKLNKGYKLAKEVRDWIKL